MQHRKKCKRKAYLIDFLTVKERNSTDKCFPIFGAPQSSASCASDWVASQNALQHHSRQGQNPNKKSGRKPTFWELPAESISKTMHLIKTLPLGSMKKNQAGNYGGSSKWHSYRVWHIKHCRCHIVPYKQPLPLLSEPF